MLLDTHRPNPHSGPWYDALMGGAFSQFEVCTSPSQGPAKFLLMAVAYEYAKAEYYVQVRAEASHNLSLEDSFHHSAPPCELIQFLPALMVTSNLAASMTCTINSA